MQHPHWANECQLFTFVAWINEKDKKKQSSLFPLGNQNWIGHNGRDVREWAPLPDREMHWYKTGSVFMGRLGTFILIVVLPDYTDSNNELTEIFTLIHYCLSFTLTQTVCIQYTCKRLLGHFKMFYCLITHLKLLSCKTNLSWEYLMHAHWC